MVFRIKEELQCGELECNCPHGASDDDGEELQWRYNTREEAERAHNSIIEAIVQDGAPPYEPSIIRQVLNMLAEGDNET